MGELADMMPAEGQTLVDATDDLVRTLDQFVYRFGKLQDALASQLFPALLTLMQEPCRDWSMRDRLARLEQLKVLPDQAEWDRIRAIRNRLVHEYPDAPERHAAVLTLAWNCAPALVRITNHVLAEAESQLAR